jgi:hypothetical protein
MNNIIKDFYNHSKAFVKNLAPEERKRLQRIFKLRIETEKLLDKIHNKSCLTEEIDFLEGPILYDCTWDNTNYWYRLNLLRTAAGSTDRDIAVIGPYSRKAVCETINRLKLGKIYDLTKFPISKQKVRKISKDLLSRVVTPEDFLKIGFPNQLPAKIVYDGILKRIRRATIDPRGSYVGELMSEAIMVSQAASHLFDKVNPKFVVLSHAVNFWCGALAWEAAKRGIPAVVAFGNYGVPRFWKIHQPNEIFDSVNRPTGVDIDNLDPTLAEEFANKGRAYLQGRLAGQTKDIGAIYAFDRKTTKLGRDQMCSIFGWDPNKPIIAVYASNWFDFPHSCGMENFVDYLDWIKVTLDAAKKNASVNWLFKSHPCDEWYGGETLSDFVKDNQVRHVRLVPQDWHGSALIHSVDALVTVAGTAGVEFAALGKPVLAADRGWYHDSKFCIWTKTRQEYIEVLNQKWWINLDLDEVQKRAQIFAGWYFCEPNWQSEFLLEDDSEQDNIYEQFPKFINSSERCIMREIALTKEWLGNDSRHYHVWKMQEHLK